MRKRITVESPDQLHFDFDVDINVPIKIKEEWIDEDSDTVYLNRESNV